jgi:hypothetical protein
MLTLPISIKDIFFTLRLIGILSSSFAGKLTPAKFPCQKKGKGVRFFVEFYPILSNLWQ